MPEVDVIRAQLFALQDKEYRVFYSRLMPTLPPETVIGVRVPPVSYTHLTLPTILRV